MVISHKHKFIFIHIPKNAGGAVRQTLMAKTDARKPSDLKQHVPAFVLKKKFKRQYDQYFTFAFVRNPWDRLWSLYKFMKNRKGEDVVGESFDEFLMEKQITHYYTQYRKPHLLTTRKPQLDWLVDDEDNIIVDFIGRQENLETDFDYVCKKIGISTPSLFEDIHKTGGKPYTEAYSQKGIDFVAKHHAKDIEMFGYKFGD